MPKKNLLGIDIGATGCKISVYDTDGKILATGYKEYQTILPKPGWVEEDPETWWLAVVSGLKQCFASGVDPGDIAGIGIGCTAATLLVDKEGKPLTNAIMLIDQRTSNEIKYIATKIGEDKIFSITGNRIAEGMFSLPTILWFKHNHPDIFDRTYKFLVPSGFIVNRLTGEFTMNKPRGSTTLLMNIDTGNWDKDLFRKIDIPEDKLPELYSSTEVIGYVTETAALSTGLIVGTPVVAGCSDTVGAAIGAGVINHEDNFAILGTCARLCISTTSNFFIPVFINCSHAEVGAWLTIAAINGTGLSLRWFRDVLGDAEMKEAKRRGKDVYEIFSEEAETTIPGANNLIYLPYLAGERSPIWDSFAKAGFIGLSVHHKRADIIRSIMEATGFAIRHNMETFKERSKFNTKVLKLGGGAAKSKIWRQIISDILQIPVVWTGERHIETLGAAIIAGVGTGIYSSLKDAIKITESHEKVQEPNTKNKNIYDQLYRVYKELYPKLKETFQELNSIS